MNRSIFILVDNDKGDGKLCKAFGSFKQAETHAIEACYWWIGNLKDDALMVMPERRERHTPYQTESGDYKWTVQTIEEYPSRPIRATLVKIEDPDQWFQMAKSVWVAATLYERYNPATGIIEPVPNDDPWQDYPRTVSEGGLYYLEVEVSDDES